MTLRDRCKQIYQKILQDGILRTGSPVETLVAFVIAEQGRAADNALDKTLPLVLYFKNEEDRNEFIAAVQEAKPGMITKKMP